MDIEHGRSRFIKHFDGTTGFVYASPGRINLIGEHTDYNGGFVFPGAIDKGMIAEIKPNGTDKVNAYSIDLKDYVTFGLNEEDAPRASWARYIFGVCREMIKRGVDVKGFNTAFSGDVPLGAGMSSSAALESTYAFALNDLFGENKIDKFELAKIGQATEHNYWIAALWNTSTSRSNRKVIVWYCWIRSLNTNWLHRHTTNVVRAVRLLWLPSRKNILM